MNEKSIKGSLNNPEELEKIYQTDKKAFESIFLKIYPEIKESLLAQFWKERLTYNKPKDNNINIKVVKKDIIFLLIACVTSCFLIKLPDIFNIYIEDYSFYKKNAGLIVMLGLSIYTILKSNLNKRNYLFISAIVLILPAIYINLLPSNDDSHSINLVYIHLPFLMWCLYGLIVLQFDMKNKLKRLDFIKFNGDLLIMGGLMVIAGIALTGLTFEMFSAIEINIEQFYMNYIAICGLVCIPIVAAHTISIYPTATNKIAPIIANIFSPIILIVLIIYLVLIPLTGKNPYEDRNFLLIFNLVLSGVMGIIVFSVSENFTYKKHKFNELVLFMLVITTLLIDIIALSAIIYRLGEFGFTPNRTAILGLNFLIFGNLILIMIDLYKINFNKIEIKKVEITIAKYIPFYIAWAIIVVFGFPFIFELK